MTLKWQDYIEGRKDVMLGKPVFKGTRLTVEFLEADRGRHDSRSSSRSVPDSQT